MKSRSLALASLLAVAPALRAAEAPSAPVPPSAPVLATPPAAPVNRPPGHPGPDTSMGLPPTLAADAVVEKLATLPKDPETLGNPFTEGTTTAPNGDVYFVEQNSNKILKWSVADKKLSVFMQPSGYANGMVFDPQGNLIACADERNELWSISIPQTESVVLPPPLNPAIGMQPGPDKVTKPVHKVIMDGKYEGKSLGGPNDVWVLPNGGIYFTDPFYARRWWAPGRRQEQDIKTVYYLSPDHKKLTRVLADFNGSNGNPGTPNGIVGTPDGKTLYVADIGNSETWSFSVQPDGSLTNKKLVANFGSDGMTLDNQGNLYLTAAVRPATPAAPGTPAPRVQQGVTVVNIASGKQVGFIPVPEGPANICFGGVDRSTLYIAARTGFYSVLTKVKGANTVK